MENVIRGIASFHASSLALPNRDEILKTIRPTKPLDKEVNKEEGVNAE